MDGIIWKVKNFIISFPNFLTQAQHEGSIIIGPVHRDYETWEYHIFFGNQSSIHHFHFCFRHPCFLAMSAQHGILQAIFVNVSFCSLTRNHSFNLDFYLIHDYVFIEWTFTRLPSFGRTQLLQPDLWMILLHKPPHGLRSA